MPDVDFWRSIYQAGTTHWDLGGPTPVFCSLADQDQFPPGDMIVIGAGRGYDARLFAKRGFKVTAVDFAPEAIRDMHMLAEPDAPVAVIKADLFDPPPIFKHAFDYVLEYTCYCAIHPSRRAEYADAVVDLLKPGGLYIALVFPIDDRSGGPPFAVTPDELIDLLSDRGMTFMHRGPHDETIKPRQGREELVIMRAG